MTWNMALIDAPVIVRARDPETGARTGEPLDGYFLHLAAELVTEALEAYRVTPAAPVQVFAGDEGPDWALTAFLKFDDEAQARAVLSDYWSNVLS